MDPYHVLGIDSDASQEEIKLAYRRVAMKWHPDRNGNSAESRERFQQAAEAYKQLFESAARAKPGESEAGAQRKPQDEYADHAGDGDASEEASADSVFWDVMLDYAIKLAQNGMSESEITVIIIRNGCPERLARTIAAKAFNINAHYAAGSGAGNKRKTRPDQSTFKQDRLDAELWRAFLGQRSYVLSARGAIESYLVTFREFRQSPLANPLRWISVNRRLLQILNFCVLLFATMLVAVHFFPGPSEYKLLSDRDLLQVPFLILPLMLAWMLYRKLWLASFGFSLFYLATLAWYDEAMPRVPGDDLATAAAVALVCFAPFVLIVLFANFLYYLKSQRMLRRARQLFDDHLDQMVWIKNRAGTSATAAFLFMLGFGTAIINLAPQHWDTSGAAGFAGSSASAANAAKLDRIKGQVDEARQFFDIGEKHFNDSPPDYLKAEMAYSTAADNGSLLAAYKLGYMYYSGEGAAQNDVLAFDYFQRATRAPLAFQPHALDITTRFLAEAYNNLGMMYQQGLGTARDLSLADRMFRRAADFGSRTAAKNLAGLYRSNSAADRKRLAYPNYR